MLDPHARITGMNTWSRLIVATLVIAALLAITHALYQHQEENTTTSRHIINIIYNQSTRTRYHCSIDLNSTHVIRTCWALKKPRLVVLDDNSTLNANSLRLYYGVTSINDTIIEVADLSRQVAYKYRTACVGSLGCYVKQLHNESFRYVKVDLWKYYPHILEPHVFLEYSDNGISLKFMIIDYTLKNCNSNGCQYLFKPTSNTSKISWYKNTLSVWCNVISIVYGVNCSIDIVSDPESPGVEAVINERYDKLWLYTLTRRLYDLYYNGSYILIVELPRPISYSPMILGEWVPSYNTVVVANHYYMGFVVIHEVGHSLGLSHHNEVFRVPRWYNQLFQTNTISGCYVSVMASIPQGKLTRYNCSRTISAGDLYVLVVNLHSYLRGKLARADEVLSEIGVWVENKSILLPLTPSNSIPEPIASILARGVASISTHDNNVKARFYPEVLELMKIIARRSSDP